MRGFRKFVFLISAIALFSSCNTDELSPCDSNQEMKGLLCKEYRHQKGEAIGYLSYFYNSKNQIVRTEYNTTKGATKKYVLFEYEGENLVKEAAFKPNGEMLRETTYSYNSDNSVSDINHAENGTNVLRRVFEYQNTILTRETEFSNELLDNYITYQYFSDDGQLYKKSYYDEASQLISYTTHEYFDNLKIRYNHYSANHNFTGYDIEHYNGDNTIQKFVSYNSQGEIVSTVKYEYDQLNLLTRSESLDSNDNIESYTVYIYH